MATPFIMNASTESALKDLKDLAFQEDRILSVETLKAYSDFDPEDSSTRPESPIPLDQTIALPLGWQVTFTIEEQPMGLSRHMSMSSPAKGRFPLPEVIQWVLPRLGFVSDLEQCVVYPEHYAEDRVAINVMELIETVQAAGAS